MSIPGHNLKSLYRDLNRSQSHIYFIRSREYITLSKPFPLNVSHCGNCGWNIHSKDRGQDEEPLIACVQLWGQMVVTSLNLLQHSSKWQNKILYYKLLLQWSSGVFLCLWFSLKILCSLLYNKWILIYMDARA